MILSICIPSYNRGKRALALVKSLLQMTEFCKDEVEIILSDNGSTVEKEEYDRISEIDDPRLKFHRFEENRFFVGNFNQVVKMSRAGWCLLLSDEDMLDVEGLDYYIFSLPQIGEVGMVRAATDVSYRDNREGFYAAGFQAVDEYFFSGNYISGIFYNRSFATDGLLRELEERYLKRDRHGYFYYPHMFLDAVLLSSHPLWRDSRLLVTEGKAAGDVPTVRGTGMHVYASYDERLLQMKGFFALLEDMDPSEEVALKMAMRLLGKTAAYIGAKKNTYTELGEDWSRIVSETGTAMSGQIEKLENTAMKKYRIQLLGYVQSLKSLYLQ